MAASDKGSTAQGAVEASEKYDVADEFYTEGVARLQEGDYAEASNCLSQSLQAKSELFGENSLEAALVSVKYGLALLESFRAQRSERDAEPAQEAGPSTSAPSKKQPAENEEDQEDLQLAWEVTEMARVVLLKNKDSEVVTAALFMELYETLGDLGTELDNYEAAIADYKEALKAGDETPEADLQQLANLNLKICLPMELSEDVDNALRHINIAAQQAKYLRKQIQAEREENLAELQQGGDGDKPAEDTEHAELQKVDARLAVIKDLAQEIEGRRGELLDLKKRVFHDLVRDRLEGRSRKIVKDKMRKVQVDLATAKLRELFGSLAEASKGKEGEPGARSDKPGTGGSGPAKAKDAADGGVAVRDPGDVRAQEPVHQEGNENVVSVQEARPRKQYGELGNNSPRHDVDRAEPSAKRSKVADNPS